MVTRYAPEAYDAARPHYPAELFLHLRPRIGERMPGPIRLLDLGCGTGRVWESIRPWAQVLPLELILVEPDEALLCSAIQKVEAGDRRETRVRPRAICSRAESIPIESGSVDLVLSGSAWPWFDSSSVDELVRILRPGAAVFVFEYQFPKAEPDPNGLNEWVRRQFNDRWRFENQIPRGSLHEKTEGLRNAPELSQVHSLRICDVRSHEAHPFAELLFTQARYLDFERRLAKEKALDERNTTLREVSARFPTVGIAPFLYRYEGFTFQKRRV